MTDDGHHVAVLDDRSTAPMTFPTLSQCKLTKRLI
jgi:hypothetical protein